MSDRQAETHDREIIPAGTFVDAVTHLYPIARLLADRGHELLRQKPNARPGQNGEMGFIPHPDCWRCPVKGVITPDDWAAVNARFELPPTIVYLPGAWGGGGTITDNANYVDIIGARDPNEPGNDMSQYPDQYATLRPYDPREAPP